MSTDYILPPLLLGGAEATIVRWLKRPGDRLAKGDPLLVAANDRVEIVFPAADEGTLEALLVAEGATVTVGAPIARMAVGPAPAPGSSSTTEEAQPARKSFAQMAAPAIEGPQRISPVARRIADAAKLDITILHGSGPSGRILKGDVLAALDERPFAATAPRPAEGPRRQPATDSGLPFGISTDRRGEGDGQPTTDGGQPTQYAPLTRMRRAIAAHMVRSRATSPHAMTAMDVDMGQVAEMRALQRSAFARRGIDLTYTACIALAAVEALLLHPLLNSAWSDEGIILRRHIHLGIAVALPDGLITPVVRQAQDLNLRGMARALAAAAHRARASALRPGEASGGTFTITNPGAGALWFGTPIISQPQSAILGVGAVRPRPLVVSDAGGDRLLVHPTTLLTLAYDARVLDQCHADAFLRDLKRKLEQFAA